MLVWATVLTACAEGDPDKTDGALGEDTGTDTADTGDTGGTESGEGRGGWFSLSELRYDVAANDSTCAVVGEQWTLGAVGFDERGEYASVGHALGSTPTDGATWTTTTDPQPAPGEAFFYLRIGAATIYGAEEGTLSAELSDGAVTIVWTSVPVFGVDDPTLTGASSGSVGCVPP